MFGRNIITRRRLVTVSFVGMALTAGGIASAAFTTNSSPWAPGTVGHTINPSASAVVMSDIYPGDCNNVQLTIHNPNTHAVTITGLSNTGFRNVSDTVASENGNANRLEDFLYQTDVQNALNGQQIGSGSTRTFVVPNAVCLSAQADDARQAKTYEAGYFVAYQLNPGTEAK